MHQSMLFIVRLLAVTMLLASSGCGLEDLNLEDNAPLEAPLKGPAAVLLSIDGSLPQFRVAPELIPSNSSSQYQLEKLLNKAASDPLVRELVVHIGAPAIDFARAGELADALNRFAASGKPVSCHIDAVDNVTYWMAARGCKRILISPAGGIDALGISLEQVFLKDLLDSLGVSAEVLSVGAYKDAAEPLTRSGFSDHSRSALESLLGEIHRIFIGGIAANRKLEEAKTQEIIDKGPYGAQKALELGLVDQVLPLGTHLDMIRSKYPGGIVDNYGKPPSQPFSMTDFLKLLGGPQGEDRSSKDQKIAIVPVIGPIASGPSEDVFGGMEMVRDLELVSSLGELARDNSVKAVVLRIDSPGGSALASDNIWHAVRALARTKPVVASLGEVAASGGYYIASAATEAIASPTTITGSIGVIGGKLVVTEAASKAGIKAERIKFGKLAGLGSPFSPFGEDGTEAIMRVMEQTYNLFIDRVAEGRGLPREKVLQVAEGRVWTGSQAIGFGLVNSAGGLHEAVNRAIALSNASPSIPVELYPKPKNFFELLGESLGDTGTQTLVSITGYKPAAQQALALASLLQRDRVLTFAPFFFEIE